MQIFSFVDYHNCHPISSKQLPVDAVAARTYY